VVHGYETGLLQLNEYEGDAGPEMRNRVVSEKDDCSRKQERPQLVITIFKKLPSCVISAKR
jgi:hypothetical protein